MRTRPRFVPVLDHVRIVRPDIDDPGSLIERRLLVVGGRIVTTPRSLVRSDASVTVRRGDRLRGEIKLAAALDHFSIDVSGRLCLDVGASAGGFTRTLLRRGARAVVAVDVGFGQLRGALRTDPRVVVLERTNVAEIATAFRQDSAFDVVTIDLSYLSLAEALPQLERLSFTQDADLVALVKPQYELGLPSPPRSAATLRSALDHAVEGVRATERWGSIRATRSPAEGARGAVEWLLHARRPPRQRSRCADEIRRG